MKNFIYTDKSSFIIKFFTNLHNNYINDNEETMKTVHISSKPVSTQNSTAPGQNPQSRALRQRLHRNRAIKLAD